MAFRTYLNWGSLIAATFLAVVGRSDGLGSAGARAGEAPPGGVAVGGRKLTHEETLRWVDEHRAWRLARKTRPIWARPVAPEEVGREFQTADHVKEIAREGFWLCVGVAGEPWFQARAKVEAKYEPAGEEAKKFEFDVQPRSYRKFKPKGTVRNWVAQVTGPGVEGFSVRPGYDPGRPLYSPAGGYVVRDEVADPYLDVPKDVWLVQQPLFESTYEILPPGRTDRRAQ